MAQENVKKTKKIFVHNFKPDYILLGSVIFLILFGLLMIYSASSYNAEVTYGNKFYFVLKQMLGVILGSCALFACYFFDYHKLLKLRHFFLVLSLILLIIVLIPGIGVERYGARRWIELPFFTLQASEIAKFGFIIFTAGYISLKQKKMGTLRGILPIIILGLGMCFLIILEPNMSITICFMLLMMSMLFFGGARIKYFVVLCIFAVIMVVVLILIEPYRLNRLVAFLNPWENPLDEGFQLIQSFYGLGSGGLFGVGLFNSRQKYLFLPFAESDFIFSIIGEELGFFGSIFIICVYAVLIARCIKIATRATDKFGAYLAGGISALIAIQVLVNIAVVTGSIPPTGLPLPFISSGSTSLIVFMSAIGVLLNVQRMSSKAEHISNFSKKKI